MFGKMKTINVKEKDLNNLKFMNISGVCYNSEAYIYLYNKYVIKKYMNVNWWGFSLEDRKKVVEFLYNNRKIFKTKLPELVLPEFYFNVNHKFAGFGMLKIDGKPLIEMIRDAEVSFDDKKNALVKVGEYLEKLEQVRIKEKKLANFYMNDLHAGNVMVLNDGQIKFIDVDGIKVSNDLQTRALYLTQPFFSKMRKLPDKYIINEKTYQFNPSRETDLYCYNMMILEMFVGENISKLKYDYYMEYLDELYRKGIDIDLLTSFAKVYESGKNINPCHILKKVKKMDLELQKCDKRY